MEELQWMMMSGLANLQLQDPKPLIAQMKNICENH
jgi:hypothetical protein